MNKIIDNPIVPEYTYIENPELDFMQIRIESGAFEGVVYHYENVSIKEEKDDAVLNFTYNIDEHLNDDIFDKQSVKTNLESTIASILQNILINQVGTIGNNENRSNDS